MENTNDTPVKSQLVLCVLPLIHNQRSSLEIMALVGDVIAADARLNMWACEVMNSRLGNVDRWMEMVNFFSRAEDECMAAVRKFNKGGNREELANALRQTTAKLNQRPDPTIPPSQISN